MSSQDIKYMIDEIVGIDTEIKSFNVRIKKMRARKAELLREISKYLENVGSSSIRYKGREYFVETQTKLISKK